MTSTTLWWLLPVLAVGALTMVAMFKYPKLWLASFFIALPVFLSDTGKGLSASELAIGGFYLVSIALWMAWAFGHGKIVLIRWWGDFLLLAFLVLSFGNCLVAMANDVPFVDWLAEWTIYLLVLYYFPIRHYFEQDERSVRQLLLLGAFSTVLMAAYSIYLYKTRMSAGGAMYAYQLWSSRSVLLGPLFVMAMLIGIASVFHLKGWPKVVATVIVLINAGALALTFTRSLWIFFFVSLIIIGTYLRPMQNVRLVLSILAFAGIGYFAAMTFNPRLTTIALRIVKERVMSSTQLSGGDFSFETRTIEAEAAGRAISTYPLGGSGIRSTVLSWGPIEQFHWRKAFIHIGYVSLPFKVGIPLALLMFWILGLFCWRSFTNGWRIRRMADIPPLTKSLLIGIVATFPTLFVVIFFTGFFDQRWGMVMLAFILAATSITHEIVERRRLNGLQQLS